MKKILFILFASSFLFLLFGCSNQSAQNIPNKISSNPPNETNANSVTIQNFVFDPAELKIKTGATVTWVNNDSVPHNVKSANFNSTTLVSGNKFEFKFDKTGAFDYACAIHPAMKGRIIAE